MFVIVWQFRVREEAVEEFERVYGSDGDWARLFRKGEGFVATDLIRDVSDRTRFLTLDRWSSRSAHDGFRATHTDEYAAIDARCEALTVSETHIGAFETVAPS